MDEATQAAVAKVQGLLSPVEGASEEEQAPTTTPETVPEDLPVEESSEESEGSEPVEAQSEGEEVEATPEEDEGPVSYTIDDLAQAAEMKQEDFLTSVSMAVKNEDGTTSQVSLQDLAKGHVRQDMFTRKTQELAETRRQLEAKSEATLAETQQQGARLNSLIATLESEVASGPSSDELDKLATENPEAYHRYRRELDKKQSALQSAQQEQYRAYQQQVAETQQAMADARTKQQTKLAEVWPDVGDPEKLSKIESGMRQYLSENQYTDQEISEFFGNFDHRQVLLVREAMRGREMLQKGKKVVKELKGKPKVLKPGAVKKQSGKLDKVTANLRRHGKTGNRDTLKQVILDKLELGA